MGDRQQRAKQDKHTHTLSILSKKADRVKELGTRDNSSLTEKSWEGSVIQKTQFLWELQAFLSYNFVGKNITNES